MNRFRLLRPAALYLALDRAHASSSPIFRFVPNSADFISGFAVNNHHFCFTKRDIK